MAMNGKENIYSFPVKHSPEERWTMHAKTPMILRTPMVFAFGAARTFMLDNWGTKIWYNGWPNGCPFFSVKSLTHLPTIALIIVNANMPKKNIVKIKTA